MNHRAGAVGISALSRTPSTMHLRPIFWMLPSAFSSIVVRPPAMLPLVGCESERSLVLWRVLVFLVWSNNFLDFVRPSRGGPPAAPHRSAPPGPAGSPEDRGPPGGVSLS